MKTATDKPAFPKGRWTPITGHLPSLSIDRDLNIWRNLPPCADGYVPAVPREYMLTVYDPFLRKECEIQVTIDLNSKPRRVNGEAWYEVSASFANQLAFACHRLTKLSDLRPRPAKAGDNRCAVQPRKLGDGVRGVEVVRSREQDQSERRSIIMKNGYICRDCNGIALQFTGSGRSVQCEDGSEDVFKTRDEAQTALDKAEETGGCVEYKMHHKSAVKSATRKAGL